MEYPKRKHPRLKGYDYAQNGAYYVTICVENHRCLLGSVDNNQVVQLSPYGQIANRFLSQIDAHYPYVKVVNYVVMPNHVHLLVQKDIPLELLIKSENDGKPIKTASLETIVHAFKALTTKEIGEPIWQDSFHDHVIRNHADIQRISDYIDANPRRWRRDE